MIDSIWVLCTGGRDFRDEKALWAALDRIHAKTPIVLIITGSCSGADAIAERWATAMHCSIDRYRAAWSRGRCAGPERNARMIRYGQPDLVLAVPGGRGTADCVRQAEAAGIRVVGLDGEEIRRPPRGQGDMRP